MEYTAGTRLRSQVCDGQFIVVRPPTEPVDLLCGGHPLIAITDEGEQQQATSGHGEQPPLGKRYTRGADDLEILVTKAAQFGLSADDEPLVLLETKPLPSSD